MDKWLPLAVEVVGLIAALLPVVVSVGKVSTGQKCLLRSDMLTIYYKNRERRTIRQYEYENFVLLYEAYKALRGNSFIDRIKQEVDEWDIVT